MLRKFIDGDEEQQKPEGGFTLVELLVVIAIMAILLVVVYVAINPLELMKKSRNARRLQDMAETRKALDLALAEATPSGTNTVFTAGQTGSSCTGSQASDGGGWIAYDNSVMNLKKYLSTLPKDPQNSNTQCYIFVAASNGTDYEINAVLETAGDATTTMQNDGGNNTAKYEVGTDLTATN